MYAETQTKKPARAMLYSAFIPGGGQIYNGKYLKAGVVVGIQAYFVGASVYHDSKEDDYAKKAVSAALPSDRLFYEKKRDEYRDKQRSDYWWIGITAILSIADAFVDAHLYDYQEQKDKVRLRFEDKMLMLSTDW
jgi:hypothetical protein